MTVLRLAGGAVYDPANGIDGEVRDVSPFGRAQLGGLAKQIARVLPLVRVRGAPSLLKRLLGPHERRDPQRLELRAELAIVRRPRFGIRQHVERSNDRQIDPLRERSDLAGRRPRHDAIGMMIAKQLLLRLADLELETIQPEAHFIANFGARFR